MDKTVLVIDDDKILRNTLAHGLRKQRFNIITAESADQARNILNKISVDCIILDRMMPGTDGLTFLKEIRSNGNTTPILMLTAMSGAENAINGLSNGADDYLGKPFQLQELILRMNNIIRKNNSSAVSAGVPNKLHMIDGEFFVINDNKQTILMLSSEEKKLLHHLTNPMGNIAPASPMVAKRLRNKINSVISDIDIITVRGHGYKLIQNSVSTANNDKDKK